MPMASECYPYGDRVMPSFQSSARRRAQRAAIADSFGIPWSFAFGPPLLASVASGLGQQEPPFSDKGRSNFFSGNNFPSTIIPCRGQFFPHSFSATGADTGHVFKEHECRVGFFEQTDNLEKKSASLSFQAFSVPRNADILAQLREAAVNHVDLIFGASAWFLPSHWLVVFMPFVVAFLAHPSDTQGFIVIVVMPLNCSPSVFESAHISAIGACSRINQSSSFNRVLH